MKKVLLIIALFAVNLCGCAGFGDHPVDGQLCCTDQDQDGYDVQWEYSGWTGEWGEEEDLCWPCWSWEGPWDCNDNNHYLNQDDGDGDGYSTCDGDPDDNDGSITQNQDSHDSGN